MKQSVGNHALQFPLERLIHLLGIASHRIHRNHYIRVYASAYRGIECNDIGIIIMVKKLAIHSQNLFIVAKSIHQPAYAPAVTLRH